MTEHLSNDEIKIYLSREMKSAELLRADEHLAVCDTCLGKISVEASPDFLPLAADESEHLSYEQLEKFVDGKADEIEREIADVHLQTCGDCAAQFEGLAEMRSLIAADLSEKSADKKSIFASLQNLFGGGFALRFAFTAAGLLIALVGIYFFLRDDKTDEIVVAPPNNILPENRVNLPVNAPPNNNSLANNVTNSPTPTPSVTPSATPTIPPEIEPVLAANDLNFPNDLQSIKNQNGKLMNGGSEAVPFAIFAPVGKIILTDRPRFSWGKFEGAESYIVNVFDTNFNPVAKSPQISATAWQIDRPLPRGKIYLWQVTAIRNGEEIKSPVRPAPDAKFKILDAAKTGELTRLSQKYKNEHLFLGMMYANAGLLDEAEREFQKEIAKNPNSTKAQRFLQKVRRAK